MRTLAESIMQILEIPATKYTPFVRLDPETKKIEIRGESYPENTIEFYSPLLAWLQEFFSLPATETPLVIEIEIIYFNSSSSKVLMNLFDELEERVQQGFAVQVFWIYDPENESALEYGEEFQEDLEHLDFCLTEKSI